MRTIEQMVAQEIGCCLSSLVATLATGDVRSASIELAELCDRALGLAMPVLDYEKAARQAGYIGKQRASDYRVTLDENGRQIYGIVCATAHEAWQHACEANQIDPVESEIREHWAVSPWLAHKLLANGEKVDTDFAALNVWARQNKGDIAADAVMLRIYAVLMA